MAVSTAAITTKRRTRRFYVGMAIAILITVFAGFSRTYFLKAQFGTPELSLLLHIHGLVFTGWVLFFLSQTTLVAARRTDIHRRLGVAGALLAALVLIMGMATAILRVKGGAAPIPGVPLLAFLAVLRYGGVRDPGGHRALLPAQAGGPQAADDPGDHFTYERADRPAANRGAQSGTAGVLRAD
jgi:hypothetical protein